MQLTIRRASAQDATVLASLRRRWTEEEVDGPIDDPEFEERFAAWLDGPARDRVSWLAFEPARAIGMLNLSVFHRMPRPGQPDRRWGYVANVYVVAEARRRGVGAMLLDAVVAHARCEEFVRLVLSPSERSIPFYRRAGFGPADGLMVRVMR
ncbi:MAG: GNAT family N-acetyltransferase [Jiangellaceae bacterium]